MKGRAFQRMSKIMRGLRRASTHEDDRGWLSETQRLALAKLRLRDFADPVTLTMIAILLTLILLAVAGQNLAARMIWGEDVDLEEVVDRRILNPIDRPEGCFAAVAAPPDVDQVYATRPNRGCKDGSDQIGVYAHDPVWRTWKTLGDPFADDFGVMDPERIDHDGRDLWVAGDEGGLARLQETNWSVVLSQKPMIVQGRPQSWSDIAGIAVSPGSDKVAFATNSGWLSYYDPASGGFSRAERLPAGNPIGLAWNGSGLWLIAKTGVHLRTGSGLTGDFLGQLAADVEDFTWDQTSVLVLLRQSCGANAPSREDCSSIIHLDGQTTVGKVLLDDKDRLAGLTASDVDFVGRTENRLILAGQFGAMGYDPTYRTWSRVTDEGILVFEQAPDNASVVMIGETEIVWMSGAESIRIDWPFPGVEPSGIAWHEDSAIVSARNGSIARILDGKVEVLFTPTAPTAPFRTERVIATDTHTMFIGKTEILLLNVNTRAYRLTPMPEAMQGLGAAELLTQSGNRAVAHVSNPDRVISFNIAEELDPATSASPPLVRLASPQPGRAVGLTADGTLIDFEDVPNGKIRTLRHPRPTGKLKKFSDIRDATAIGSRLIMSWDGGVEAYDLSARNWQSIDDAPAGAIAVREVAGKDALILTRPNGQLVQRLSESSSKDMALTGQGVSLVASQLSDAWKIDKKRIALAGNTPEGQRRLEIYDADRRRITSAFDYADNSKPLRIIGMAYDKPVVLNGDAVQLGARKIVPRAIDDPALEGWVDRDAVWTIRQRPIPPTTLRVEDSPKVSEAAKPARSRDSSLKRVHRPSIYLHRQQIDGVETCWFKPMAAPPNASLTDMIALQDGLSVGLAGGQPVVYDRDWNRWMGPVEATSSDQPQGWQIARIDNALYARPKGSRSDLVRVKWPVQQRTGCESAIAQPILQPYSGIAALDPKTGKVLTLDSGQIRSVSSDGAQTLLAAPEGSAPERPLRVWLTDTHLYAVDHEALWSYNRVTRLWASKSLRQLNVGRSGRLSRALFYERQGKTNRKPTVYALLNFGEQWAEVSIAPGQDVNRARARRLRLPEIDGKYADLGRIHSIQEVSGIWAFVGEKGVQVYDPRRQQWHKSWRVSLGSNTKINILDGHLAVHDPSAKAIWIASRRGADQTADQSERIDLSRFVDWVVQADRKTVGVIGIDLTGAIIACLPACQTLRRAPVLMDGNDAMRVYNTAEGVLTWGERGFNLVQGTERKRIRSSDSIDAPRLVVRGPAGKGTLIVAGNRLMQFQNGSLRVLASLRVPVDAIEWSSSEQVLIASQLGRPVAVLDRTLRPVFPDVEQVMKPPVPHGSRAWDAVVRPSSGAVSAPSHVAAGENGSWVWVQRRFGVTLYRKDRLEQDCEPGMKPLECQISLRPPDQPIVRFFPQKSPNDDLLALLSDGSVIRWRVPTKLGQRAELHIVGFQKLRSVERDAESFRNKNLSRRPDGEMALYGGVKLRIDDRRSIRVTWGFDELTRPGRAARLDRQSLKLIDTDHFAWDAQQRKVEVKVANSRQSLTAVQFIARFLSDAAYQVQAITPGRSGGFDLVGRFGTYRFDQWDMRDLRRMTSAQAIIAPFPVVPDFGGFWMAGSFFATDPGVTSRPRRVVRLGQVRFEESADELGVQVSGPGTRPILTSQGFAWDRFLDIGWSADGRPMVKSAFGPHLVTDVGILRSELENATVWSADGVARARALQAEPDWPFNELPRKLGQWPDGTTRYGFAYDLIQDAFMTESGVVIRDQLFIRSLSNMRRLEDQPEARRDLRRTLEQRRNGRAVSIGRLRTVYDRPVSIGNLRAELRPERLKLVMETRDPSNNRLVVRDVAELGDAPSIDRFYDVRVARDGTVHALSDAGVFSFRSAAPSWLSVQLWRHASGTKAKLHLLNSGDVAVEYAGGAGGCFVLGLVKAVPCPGDASVDRATSRAGNAQLRLIPRSASGTWEMTWLDPAGKTTEVKIENGVFDFDVFKDISYCLQQRQLIDVAGRAVIGPADRLRHHKDQVLGVGHEKARFACTESIQSPLPDQAVLIDQDDTFFYLSAEETKLQVPPQDNFYKQVLTGPGERKLVRIREGAVTAFDGEESGRVTHYATWGGKMQLVPEPPGGPPDAVPAFDRLTLAGVVKGRALVMTPMGLVDYGAIDGRALRPRPADLQTIEFPAGCDRYVARPASNSFLLSCGGEKALSLSEQGQWIQRSNSIFFNWVSIGALQAQSIKGKGASIQFRDEFLADVLNDGRWSFDRISDMEFSELGIVTTGADGIRRYPTKSLALMFRSGSKPWQAEQELRKTVGTAKPRLHRLNANGRICAAGEQGWTILPDSIESGRGLIADQKECLHTIGRTALRQYGRDDRGNLHVHWLGAEDAVDDRLQEGRFYSDRPWRLPTRLTDDKTVPEVCYPFSLGGWTYAVVVGPNGRQPSEICPPRSGHQVAASDGDKFIVRDGRLFRGPFP